MESSVAPLTDLGNYATYGPGGAQHARIAQYFANASSALLGLSPAVSALWLLPYGYVAAAASVNGSRQASGSELLGSPSNDMHTAALWSLVRCASPCAAPGFRAAPSPAA